MDPARFFSQSTVCIVAGKGGVGKSTTAATIAAAAATVGLSVLLVELDGKDSVPTLFNSSSTVGYQPTPIELEGATGSLSICRITSDDALLEYLADHGMKRISRRLVSSGVVDVIATAIPGIRDVLVLGKVKSLETSGVADFIVVDAPATGHAITFLGSARGLIDTARSGPVRTQAEGVVAMLEDPARSHVMLVTLAEELPATEAIEAAYGVEERASVFLGPLVVNDLVTMDPALSVPLQEAASSELVDIDPAATAVIERARIFSLRRHDVGARELARLRRELPLPQVHLPHVEADSLGPGELAILVAAFLDGISSLPERELT